MMIMLALHAERPVSVKTPAFIIQNRIYGVDLQTGSKRKRHPFPLIVCFPWVYAFCRSPCCLHQFPHRNLIVFRQWLRCVLPDPFWFDCCFGLPFRRFFCRYFFFFRPHQRVCQKKNGLGIHPGKPFNHLVRLFRQSGNIFHPDHRNKGCISVRQLKRLLPFSPSLRLHRIRQMPDSKIDSKYIITDCPKKQKTGMKILSSYNESSDSVADNIIAHIRTSRRNSTSRPHPGNQSSAHQRPSPLYWHPFPDLPPIPGSPLLR